MALMMIFGPKMDYNFNNAPVSLTSPLSSVGISNAKYYDFDVTNFVETQLAGDKTVSLMIKDPKNPIKILYLTAGKILKICRN